MAPKKKSLADELADLFNPAPTKEFDPEADVFGAGPALEESDEELAAAQPARRRGKEGARLRGELVMEGREYAGRRTSRAALFGEEEDAEEEEEEEGSEGELGGGSEEGGSGSEEEGASGASSGEEEGSGDDDADEQQQDEAWLNGGASGSGSEDDEAPEEEMAGSGGAGRLAARRAAAAVVDDEMEGGSEDGEGRGGQAAGAAAGGDDEMAALEREYEQMQQDEQSAMAGLKERAARERKKALAVQAQKAVWQRGLEARILLQRALAGGNRLPQGEMQAAAAASSADMAAAFGGLAADASALLQDLLQLVGALAGQNPAVAEAADAAGAGGQAAAVANGSGSRHKRARGEDEEQQQDGAQPPAAGQGQRPGAEALWGQVEAAYAAVAPFRDSSIDRWHRKTTLTAGGATLRGGQLKALNQSVSTQVAQLMQDPGKVLERTRLPRSAQQQHAARLLCPDPEAAPVAKRGRWSDDEEPAANSVDAKLEEERDPETYDDSEFYQTLLREFLEGSADAGGANWHTGPKHRKAVDRRASKGRKLRYHVHSKLVNFMTPVELEAPQFAAQLFSNLFGGAGNRAAKHRCSLAAARNKAVTENVGTAAGMLLRPPPGPPPLPPPPLYTPFSLPLTERHFAYELARMDVPTLVTKLRRLLTAQLALAALLNDIPGDFVEAGAYTGGTSIIMAKVLERYDASWSGSGGTSSGSGGAASASHNSGGGSGGAGPPGESAALVRRLWAADSFEGTPAPVEQDGGGGPGMRSGFQGEYATSLETFKTSLKEFGLGGHLEAGRLQILKGWFNETLPGAPIQRIAFLRLDGDLYVSTRDSLEALYDRLSPGGLVYLDDYGAYTGCQRAVLEFRQRRGIRSPLNIQPVPEQVMFVPPAEETRWAAAWWVKEPHEPTWPPLRPPG
ncbi:AATF isoform X1 [Chlorella sorokiniana]|uniref:AATF isoform X1 n=1 Tax=Chlorella sorokiniana TaxID=3076 RepID=A0A2P6U5F3_CHLSO|nr:AATF isoform X1 [Chlorella sorokiniana]|eukprot:PRW61539.1 AATF isoform X1 [Chlorella sorokiniana]